MVSKIGNEQHIKTSLVLEKKHNKDDFSMMVSKKFKDDRKKKNEGDTVSIAMPHSLHAATLRHAEGGFSKNEKTSPSKAKLVFNDVKIHQKGVANTLAKQDAEKTHKLTNELDLGKQKNNYISGSAHNDALKKTPDGTGLGGTVYTPDAQFFSNKNENAKNGALNTSLSSYKPIAQAAAQDIKYDDKFHINYNFNRWEGKPSASVRVQDNASIDPRIIVSTSDVGTKAILSQHSQLFAGNSTLYFEQHKDGEDKGSQSHFQDEEGDE